MVGDDLGRDDASAERANWYLRREWIALSDGLRLMNRTREQEASKLLQAVWSIRSLERAWRVIQANAQSSKSLEVRREVDEFRENAASNVRSISSRLSARTFKFQPAKGIPIPKKDAQGNNIPGKFRPIVLANIESRIVQRSILEALMGVPELAKYVHTPYSFGGIRKKSKEDASAVPAAISAVLEAIGNGANFLMSADIEKFFTRIPKSKVVSVIASAVNDATFVKLLEDAIAVELSNMALLQEKAEAFPLYDVGVAQGNSLSPLLGNILLFEFDQRMNEGDCRCVRYIDDIVILAPSKKAAKAKMKLARKLLASFDMSFGAAKTQLEPKSITERFEFLGIELNNGMIRPSEKARDKLLASLNKNFAESQKGFRGHASGKSLKKEQSLLSTLRRIDGIMLGWGKHYRFCNDKVLLNNLDDRVTELIRGYIAEYAHARRKSQAGSHRALLGIDSLHLMERKPLQWPKLKTASSTIDNPSS